MGNHAQRIVVVALAVAVVAPAMPVSAQMSQAEFERTLSAMQTAVDDAVQAYRDGDRRAALGHARDVSEHFTFNGSGASPLERKIKAVSAIAIGDQVKAYSSKLTSAIEADANLTRVEEIADELRPSLNRLVLVAQGKTTPASQRTLRTSGEIDAAAQAVLDLVNQSVARYAQGDAQEAKTLAEEAFFEYETNGMGPDTSTVDDALENRVENMIVNFQQGGDPGLSQLINRSADLSTVQTHRDAIVLAIQQNVAVLKATLPPLDLGDVNADGKVSIVDALLTAQAALGIREKGEAMDVNRDGRVSIVDALMISQAALGIRSL